MNTVFSFSSSFPYREIRALRHHSVQTGCGAHPASYLTGTGVRRLLPPVYSSKGVKLTTQHLVPRLRMCGAIRPLPQYVFMAWCFVLHVLQKSYVKLGRYPNVKSLNFNIWVINSRINGWTGHIARTRDMRDAHKILIAIHKGKRSLGRRKRRWGGNIRMNQRNRMARCRLDVSC
jgi:hypothetical protein